MTPTLELVTVGQFTAEQIAAGRSDVARYVAELARERGFIGPGAAPRGALWLVSGNSEGGRLLLTASDKRLGELPPLPLGTTATLRAAEQDGLLPVLVALNTDRGTELSVCALPAAGQPGGWVRVVGPAPERPSC